MSVATPFLFHQPFPFCMIGPWIYPYAGGLSLAQVMHPWWNLEDLVLSISASATTSAGNLSWSGTVRASDLAATGDFAHASMIPIETSNALRQLPGYVQYGTPSAPVRQPRERVCWSSPPYYGTHNGQAIVSFGTYLESDQTSKAGRINEWSIWPISASSNGPHGLGYFFDIDFWGRVMVDDISRQVTLQLRQSSSGANSFYFAGREMRFNLVLLLPSGVTGSASASVAGTETYFTYPS